MPDTVFEEDALADNVSEYSEEEERPLTFAELGVPGPLVRVLAADDKKTAFPIQADTLPDSLAARPWRSPFRWSPALGRWMPTNTRT